MVIRQDDEGKRIEFDRHLCIDLSNRSFDYCRHRVIGYQKVMKLDMTKKGLIDYQALTENRSIEFEDQKKQAFEDVLSIDHKSTIRANDKDPLQSRCIFPMLKFYHEQENHQDQQKIVLE